MTTDKEKIAFLEEDGWSFLDEEDGSLLTRLSVRLERGAGLSYKDHLRLRHLFLKAKKRSLS